MPTGPLATVGFQSEASLQGRTFESVVKHILLAQEFAVAPKKVQLRHIGVEIDFEAVSKRGTKLWIEAKGTPGRAAGDRRPGLERTDTMKKAICNAALVAYLPPDDRHPFVIVTTHLPLAGSAGEAMLRTALDAGYVADVVMWTSPEDLARLGRL
jgi:hypothetical protein